MPIRKIGYGRAERDFQILDSLTAGAGITGGTGTVYRAAVTRVGNMAKTEILIDLTGLECPTTIGDIIGVNGSTDAAHIGRIDPDYSGTVIAGRVTCLEAPAGGDPDIDIYAADEGTGVENGAIGDLTETLLVNAGDHTLGSVDVFTALPTAGQYLYLTAGTITEATYTGGKLLIELWGTL